MFRKPVAFNEANVRKVPHDAGVYVIYQGRGRQRVPFYVGCSSRDIRARLTAHLHSRGSRRVAQAVLRRVPMEFEYELMVSVEQAEAVLIERLGTTRLGNLRRETDPADWE